MTGADSGPPLVECVQVYAGGRQCCGLAVDEVVLSHESLKHIVFGQQLTAQRV